MTRTCLFRTSLLFLQHGERRRCSPNVMQHVEQEANGNDALPPSHSSSACHRQYRPLGPSATSWVPSRRSRCFHGLLYTSSRFPVDLNPKQTRLLDSSDARLLSPPSPARVKALQEPLRDGLEFCGRNSTNGQGQHISGHYTICVGLVHRIVVACTSPIGRACEIRSPTDPKAFVKGTQHVLVPGDHRFYIFCCCTSVQSGYEIPAAYATSLKCRHLPRPCPNRQLAAHSEAWTQQM